jgi:hypothetical protein
MLDALDITAEEAAGLTELAALELATAKRFTERANATEDPDEANRFARTAQRAARSFRQTLALKVRLKRALAEHGREYAGKASGRRDPIRQAPPPVPPHLSEVREAVARIAWTEHEALEAPEVEREDFLDDMLYGLDEALRGRARDADFAAQPLDDQVAEIACELALPELTARRWRELPDPPPEALEHWLEPEPPPPPWRGSG